MRLPVPLARPPRKRQPPARSPNSRHANHPLADPQHARPANVFLRAADGVLQAPRLGEVLVAHGLRGGELHEADDRLGVEGREAIDDARRTEEDDGAELLAETAVDAELGVVYLGVGGDLDVVRDVAVGPACVSGVGYAGGVEVSHFAAYDVGVLGELRVGVRLDDDPVRDAGVVVSGRELAA